MITLPVIAAGGYLLLTTQQQLRAASGGDRPDLGAAPRPSRKPTDPWLTDMVDWYYGHKNSEQWEELFIRDFFRDQKGGVFVDIGASDYREASLTYFLDKHLGWSGVAVDAIAHYGKDYEKYRPRTQFFSFYVGDKDGDKAEFFVVHGDERKSSGAKELGDRYRDEGRQVDETEVQTITLNTLLTKAGVDKIDLLTMDIELAEEAALKGFDVTRFQPKLVVVEAYDQVRPFITEYFAKAGYELMEQYTTSDARNLYYAPKALHEQWKQRKAPWDEVDAQFPVHRSAAAGAPPADTRTAAAP